LRNTLAALALLSGCADQGAAVGDGAADGGVDAPHADAPADAPVLPPFSGTLTGRVTSGGAGVQGATVRFGGQPDTATSGADGSFTLVVTNPVALDQLGLTAGKRGYWNGGIRVTDPTAPQQIEIAPVSLVDNPAYVYKSPDVLDSTPHCIHCHPHQYQGWNQSGHSRAALDPQLHDLYNGTALYVTAQSDCEARGGTWRSGKAYGAAGAAAKCYVDGGAVLADLNPGVCGGPAQPTCDDPTAPAGNRPADVAPCADCHAPASQGHVAGATNLNDVDGLAFDKGVHCDFCHKIGDVLPNDLPGLDGAISLVRPGPPGPTGWSNPEMFFGPYSDVIVFFMGASIQPQFRTSEFCSGCHQWLAAGFRPEDKPLVDLVKWPSGLPIQDTYAEWSQSPQAAAGTHCQSCHEPGAPWENATVDFVGLPPDPGGTRGWPREFGEVRAHTFAPRPAPPDTGYVPAPGDVPVDQLRDPIDVVVEPSRTATDLDLTIRLTNTGAGHDIPSGTPSRALLLLVEAEGPVGPLEATGGYTVPAWTGALASGVLGSGGVVLAGNQLTLPSAWPAGVVAGSMVRFVQPSGTFADYPGTRWFADALRTPAEKGMEIVEPAATATVLSVAGDTATLDRSLALPDGTVFLAGAPAPAGPLAVDDELPVSALAGEPGWAFSKVMKQSDGTLFVPFFRAMDIASDNRIPAGAQVSTSHRFDVTGVAGDVTVTVTLLYRKFPYPIATLRAWPAVDQVRKRLVVTVPP
jgi:hypothetical protein